MAKVLIVISALFIGVLARWMPHPPNFSPVIAISIFMGLRFANRSLVAAVPIAIMFISDLALGFHSLSLLTYITLAILALVVHGLPKTGVWSSKPLQVASYSLGGSILFFLVSNGAVWWTSGMYVKNFAGLTQSYLAGVPFFQNSLTSSILFTAILVVVDKLILKQTSTVAIKA